MQCLTSSVKATLDCGVIKKIRILSALKCKYGYHSFLHCQENLDNHQKYSLTAARSHFLLNYFLTLFNRGVRIQKAISINFSQSIRKNMTNFSSSLIKCLREGFKKKIFMENSITRGGLVRVIFHIQFFYIFFSPNGLKIIFRH